MIDAIQDVEIVLTLPNNSEIPYSLQAPMNFRFGFRKIPLLEDFRDADNILREGHFKYQFFAIYEYEWHEMDLRHLLIATKILLRFPPEFRPSRYQTAEVLLANDSVVKNYLENFVGKLENETGSDAMPSGSITLEFEGTEPLSEADVRSIRYFLPPIPPPFPPGPGPEPGEDYETDFTTYPDGDPMVPGCLESGKGWTIRYDSIYCDWEIIEESGSNILRFTRNSESGDTLKWALSLDQFDSKENVEITAKIRSNYYGTSNTWRSRPGVISRASDSGVRLNCALYYPRTNSTIDSQIYVETNVVRPGSTLYSSIGRFESFIPDPNTWYWIKFRVQGDKYYFKYWQDGNIEPSEFNDVGLTRLNLSSGFHGLIANTQRPFDIGYFRISEVASVDVANYFRTDFSEYGTSQPFTGYYTGNAVVGGLPAINSQSEISILGQKHAIKTGQQSQIRINEISSQSDTEVLTLMQFTASGGADAGPMLRRSSSTAFYYLASVTISGQGQVRRLARRTGTFTSVAISGNIPAHSTNTWFWIRARSIGSNISYKIWEFGSIEPEENTLSAIDSNIISGLVGLFGSQYIANYLAVSNGESIPLPTDILPGGQPPPPEISMQLAVLVSGSDITFRWTPLGNSGYNLFLDSGEGFEQLNDEPLTEETYYLLDLPDGEYSAYVVSISPNLTSNTVNFSPNLPVSQSVVLSVQVVGNDAILSWPILNLGYVTGYDVYMDSGSGFEFVANVDRNTGTYTLESLANGNYQAYIITKATSGLSNSLPSNTVAFEILGAFADSPENLIVNVVDDTAELDWDTVPDADGYNVYLDSGSGFVKVNVSTIITNSYDIIDLPDGVYRAYVTTVRSGFTESLPSNIVNFSISFNATVDAPSNLSVTLLGNVGFFEWDVVTGADGYNLYLSVNNGEFEKYNSNLITGLSYYSNTLNRATYRAYVTAFDSPNESAPSNVVTFDVVGSGFIQINSSTSIAGSKAEGRLVILGNPAANTDVKVRVQRVNIVETYESVSVPVTTSESLLAIATNLATAIRNSGAGNIFDITAVNDTYPYVRLLSKSIGTLRNNYWITLFDETNGIVPHEAGRTEGGTEGTFIQSPIDVLINNQVFATTSDIIENDSISTILTKLLDACNSVTNSGYTFSVSGNRLIAKTLIAGQIPISLNVRTTGIQFQTSTYIT